MDIVSELRTILVDGPSDSVRIFVREFVKSIGISYVNKTYGGITEYILDLGDGNFIELIHGNVEKYIASAANIICVYSYIDDSFAKLTNGRLVHIMRKYKGAGNIIVAGLRSDIAIPGKIRHNNNALWHCHRIKHIQLPSPNRADEKMRKKMESILKMCQEDTDQRYT